MIKPCRHEYIRHLYKEDGCYRHKYICSKCKHEYLSQLKIPVKNTNLTDLKAFPDVGKN